MVGLLIASAFGAGWVVPVTATHGVGTITACPAAAPGCDYTSIQAAIDHANAGDTVEVAAGVYSESLVVDTDFLTLKGATGDPAHVVVQNTAEIVLFVRADQFTLRDITIRAEGAPSGPGNGEPYAVRVGSGATAGFTAVNAVLVGAKTALGIFGDGLPSGFDGVTVTDSRLTVTQETTGFAFNGDGVRDVLVTGTTITGGKANVYFEDDSTADIALNNNTYVGGTWALYASSSVQGAQIDARFNDWGAYTRSGVDARMSNNGVATTVDSTCFSDGLGSWLECAIPVHNAATGQGYWTIQDAISAASTGDTILLGPGTYLGGLTMDKALTLCQGNAENTGCGSDPADVVIDGNGAIYTIWVSADDVTIEGVTVQNPSLTTVDQDWGAVDPSLIVVYADRFTLRNAILQDPASRLLAGESRWHTVGVNIGTGSDDTTVEDVLIRNMPDSLGPDGTCFRLPCRTTGVFDWSGGAGLSVVDSTIVMPAGDLQDLAVRSVGIGAGVMTGALVSGNTITLADGAAPGGLYGVFGEFGASEFSGNTFERGRHGLFLRTNPTGDNIVSGNTFRTNSEGVRNYPGGTQILANSFDGNARSIVLAGAQSNGGSSLGIAINENMFQNNQYALSLLSQLSGASVDARENDWGVYNRSQIALFVDDAGTGNDVDVSCFIDSDHVSTVCPPTPDFSFAPVSPKWDANVQFSDASASGGRDLNSWTWSFSDGGTASGQSVGHVFAASGTFTATLTVTDEEGYSGSVTKPVTVWNTAPVFAAPAAQTVMEGSQIVTWITGSDADGDRVTYSATGLPSGAMLVHSSSGNNSAYVAWTPGYAASGDYTVTISATDGDLSAPSAALVIHVLDHSDHTAPVTVSSVSGTQAPSGWYTSTATVALTVSDAGGSGLLATYYRLNGGARIGYNPAAKIGVPTEGTTVVSFWSEDRNGNVEATQTVTVRVDKSGPSVAITSPAGLLGTDTALSNGGNVNFTVSTSDGVGSGVVQVKMFLDGVLVKVDTTGGPYYYNWDATGASLGRHTFMVRATDGVGFSAETTRAVLKIG
ncbi:MAG: PKD domain-containing protein [Euryarchaeota archaeon]|nr:PKD domain-containing protein [Euryarchaeota archaeon]